MRKLPNLILRNILLVSAFVAFCSFTLIELLVVIAIIGQSTAVPCDHKPTVFLLLREDQAHNGQQFQYSVEETNPSAQTVLATKLTKTITTDDMVLVFQEPVMQINSGSIISNFFLYRYTPPQSDLGFMQHGAYYQTRICRGSCTEVALPFSVLFGILASQQSPTVAPDGMYYYALPFQFLDCRKLLAECNTCGGNGPVCDQALNEYTNAENINGEFANNANSGFRSIGAYHTSSTSNYLSDPDYPATGVFQVTKHNFVLDTPVEIEPGESKQASAWIRVKPGANNVAPEDFDRLEIGFVRPEGLEVEQLWPVDVNASQTKWVPFQVKLYNPSPDLVVLSELTFKTSARVLLDFAENPLEPTQARTWQADCYLDALNLTCVSDHYVKHMLDINSAYFTTAPGRGVPKRNQFIPGHTEHVDLGVHKDYMSAFPYYCEGLPVDDSYVPAELAPTNVCEDYKIEFDIRLPNFESFKNVPFSGQSLYYSEPLLSRLSSDGRKGWRISLYKSRNTSSSSFHQYGFTFVWTFDETYKTFKEGDGPFSSCQPNKEIGSIDIRLPLSNSSQQSECLGYRQWHVTLDITKLMEDTGENADPFVFGTNSISLKATQPNPSCLAQYTASLVLPIGLRDADCNSSQLGSTAQTGQWPPFWYRQSNRDIRLAEVGQYPLIIGNANPNISATPIFNISNLKITKGTNVVLDMPFNQPAGEEAMEYSPNGAFGKLVNYSESRSKGGNAWILVD